MAAVNSTVTGRPAGIFSGSRVTASFPPAGCAEARFSYLTADSALNSRHAEKATVFSDSNLDGITNFCRAAVGSRKPAAPICVRP